MAVAFDAVTTAKEQGGDGILSLSHTAVAIDNTAAFVGVGTQLGNVVGDVTYAGGTVTELWDFHHTATGYLQNAGYSVVGVDAGAQTVTSTRIAAVGDHSLGVVTMTGVHQTTPVGTAATAQGHSATASVTVSSPGTDDVIIDNMVGGASWGDPTMTAQTGRVERWAQDGAWVGAFFRGSSKPGSTAGANEWTGSSDDWTMGAVAFKTAAAAVAPAIVASVADFKKEKLRQPDRVEA